MELPKTLYDWQKIARKHIYSDNFRNYLVVWPTGGGKTLAGMMAADKIIKEGNRVIYGSPMKALTSQQTDDFSKEWKVKEITGDTGPDISYTPDYLEQFDVYIFTFEKLFSILKKDNTRELFFDDLNVDLVIIDEVHMIGDDSRGTALEKLIMINKTLYPFVHSVYLSATIGNYQEIAKFLDADINYVPREMRPVPLQLDIKMIPMIYGSKKKFNFKMNIVHQFINEHPGEKTLFFWSSQERSVEAAKKLAGISEQQIYGKKLIESLLSRRIAYHNKSIDAPTRKKIEAGFRGNELDIVSSTTTLSVGVNTPARNVIIGDVVRYNYKKSQEELLKPSEFHQMVGRAGRPGLDTIGRGIIICDEDYYDDVKEILDSDYEVTSKMSTNVDSHVLDFVTSSFDNRETLHAIMETGMNPPPEKDIDDALDWLIEKRFVVDEDDTITPTNFGRMTSLSFILPKTALHIVFTDKEVDPSMSTDLEFITLFDKLMNVNEALDTIIVRDNDNDDLALSIAEKVYKFSDNRISKAFAFIFFPFLAKKGILTPEEKNLGTGNEVESLKDDCTRIVYAASKICSKHKRIYDLLGSMIESGYLDAKMIEIYNIRGIGDVRLGKLADAGIDSLKKFVEKSDAELSVIMGVSVDQVQIMKLEGTGHSDEAKAKAEAKKKSKKKENPRPFFNSLDNFFK